VRFQLRHAVGGACVRGRLTRARAHPVIRQQVKSKPDMTCYPTIHEQSKQLVTTNTDRAATFVWVYLSLVTSRDTTGSCTVIMDAHQ
jgi:hypothetical protein